jgi:prevent-host-death family protein
MPAIYPVSDLKNYYSGIVNSVSYGNRVYLTKNGVGKCAMVDMRELEDLDKQKAVLNLMAKLTDARASVSEAGGISAEILEKELGM